MLPPAPWGSGWEESPWINHGKQKVPSPQCRSDGRVPSLPGEPPPSPGQGQIQARGRSGAPRAMSSPPRCLCPPRKRMTRRPSPLGGDTLRALPAPLCLSRGDLGGPIRPAGYARSIGPNAVQGSSWQAGRCAAPSLLMGAQTPPRPPLPHPIATPGQCTAPRHALRCLVAGERESPCGGRGHPWVQGGGCEGPGSKSIKLPGPAGSELGAAQRAGAGTGSSQLFRTR